MNKTNIAAGSLVPPRSDAGTNDIRAIKPPVDIPLGWWTWVIALVLLAALGLAIWLWWRRRNQPVHEPPPPIIPPHVRAKRRLEQALGLLSDPRLFCIAVSDTARVYLEERFTLHAPERTTEEFLQELRQTDHLLHDQKLTLGQFLERCDLVKFAKLEPTETELRSLYEIAERLIDETAPLESGSSGTTVATASTLEGTTS